MFYRLLWWSAGAPLTVAFHLGKQGVENVPAHGPAILASNHLSFLDHLLMPLPLRRHVHFISKVQHFDNPVFRFVFERIGVIPLRRGESDQVAFERALETIRAGRVFAIYPEGTRSLDGKLHRGHTGVARLAYLTGAPVVPVAMMGTFEAMPKGQRFPKRVPCEVRFGKPIAFARDEALAADRHELRARTDSIMRAIAELSGQAYEDRYQYNPEVRTHARDDVAAVAPGDHG